MDITEVELEAIHQTLHRLEQRWVFPLPDSNLFYAYSALPVAEFLPTVQEVSALTEGRRFMDIGCGIGTKLALMHVMGWRVAGLDRHGPYIESARELVPEADVIHADLREIDRFDADLVYMYRPGVSDELEEELERHVVERMTVGSLFFLPDRELDAIDGMTKISRWLWEKR